MLALTEEERVELKRYLASEFHRNWLDMAAGDKTFFGVRVGLKASISVCQKYNLTPDELCNILEHEVSQMLKG